MTCKGCGTWTDGRVPLCFDCGAIILIALCCAGVAVVALVAW